MNTEDTDQVRREFNSKFCLICVFCVHPRLFFFSIFRHRAQQPGGVAAEADEQAQQHLLAAAADFRRGLAQLSTSLTK